MKNQERDGSGCGPVRWKRRTVEEIGRILAGYQDSGLTQREYAQRAGVSLSTLLRWLRIHGNLVGPQRSRKSAVWVPVAVKSESERESTVRAYVVEFGEGSRLTIPPGFDVDEARALIQLVGLCSR